MFLIWISLLNKKSKSSLRSIYLDILIVKIPTGSRPDLFIFYTIRFWINMTSLLEKRKVTSLSGISSLLFGSLLFSECRCFSDLTTHLPSSLSCKRYHTLGQGKTNTSHLCSLLLFLSTPFKPVVQKISYARTREN